MLGTQGDFGFGDMRKIGHVVRLPRKQTLTVEERDRRIVEFRRQDFSHKQIKEKVICSDATIMKVLRRDAPELLKKNKRKDPPKDDPRTEAQLLALPPTDDDPFGKIGVHFWDIAEFGQCKFIVARDPDDKLARYCGEGTVTFGCFWCSEHLRVVAQPKFRAEAA